MNLLPCARCTDEAKETNIYLNFRGNIIQKPVSRKIEELRSKVWSIAPIFNIGSVLISRRY
jgi:hypothetical protein